MCYVEGLASAVPGDICASRIVSAEECALLPSCGKGEGRAMVEHGTSLCVMYICSGCEVLLGK